MTHPIAQGRTKEVGILGLLAIILFTANAVAALLAGGDVASNSQLNGYFQGSSNSFLRNNSQAFADMSSNVEDASGNSGTWNAATNMTGNMQMSKSMIYTWADGQTPQQFAASGSQAQIQGGYTNYFTEMEKEPEMKTLEAQAQSGTGTLGGQPVDAYTVAACAQLGGPTCRASIKNQCSSVAVGQGGDGAVNVCTMAAKARNGKASSPANSSNNSSTPATPARTNPCTCPGNHEGTDAQLMKESCPTNTSSVQNWPHTNTYYLGSPPPKVAVGTNVCDPSAPQRVPDNFSPVSGDTSPSTPTNTSNTANAASDGKGGTGSGDNTHGGTVANLSKAQAAAGTGQCLGQNCQCAALVQGTSNVGSTNNWTRGDQVIGSSDLKSGTVIATFNGADGGYNTPEIYGHQHTAIYLGQDSNGIQVLDQSNKSGGVQQRTIPYGSGYESAQKFYVVR